MNRWLAFALFCLLTLLPGHPCFAFSLDADEIEEPGGEGFTVLLNPDAGVYGVSGNSATWIRGAPVFGDYFVALFWNDIEEAFYAGVGLTVRAMPRWRVAPFLGAGGSYNHSFTVAADEDPADENFLDSRGSSYWGGHVETGVRFGSEGVFQYLEVLLRYTWSTLDGDRDYWLLGVGSGSGLDPIL